jgi:hypothetical protein
LNEILTEFRQLKQEVSDLKQVQLHVETYVPNKEPQSEIVTLEGLVSNVIVPLCSGTIKPLFEGVGALGGIGGLGKLGELKRHGNLSSTEYQCELEREVYTLRQQLHARNNVSPYYFNPSWDESYGA